MERQVFVRHLSARLLGSWNNFLKSFFKENENYIHSNLHLARVSVVAYAKCPSTSRNVNSQGRANYFQPSVSRLQVNALHTVFSMSGNECKRCALLLTLM